jgi:hypothetical protein
MNAPIKEIDTGLELVLLSVGEITFPIAGREAFTTIEMVYSTLGGKGTVRGVDERIV